MLLLLWPVIQRAAHLIKLVQDSTTREIACNQMIDRRHHHHLHKPEVTTGTTTAVAIAAEAIATAAGNAT